MSDVYPQSTQDSHELLQSRQGWSVASLCDEISRLQTENLGLKMANRRKDGHLLNALQYLDGDDAFSFPVRIQCAKLELNDALEGR